MSNSGTFGEALGDRFSSIENLTGSNFDDVLFGNASVNIIRGGAGNDTIFGNGGLDQLFGDQGDDNFVFTGLQTYASIDGGSGFDTIKAGADNARLAIGTLTGVEAISGDGYANVVINGSAANNVFNFAGITLTGIAAINGNDGLDDISGSNGDDVINGGTGNDNLRGGNGNDIIRGNNGIDTVTGGAGADIFVFSRTESGRSQPLADIITDFVVGVDKIDLSLIDANITNGAGNNDAFDFIGFDEFSGAAGELRINSIGPFFYVEADLNGDGRADFAVNVNPVPDLAATDFIL